MKYKYIITDKTNPYENLALERCLFDMTADDEAIIYLWQNDNTIVIGKNQNLYSECKAEEFQDEGGRIARRYSGGGAVYHDLGNLNFSIICKDKEKEECRYQMVINMALKEFGLAAEYNGKNDLVIQNKKFSGNAFYDSGEIYCQHGTILINSDIEKMAYYLTPKKSKLERNHVQSVTSRVINLSDICADITVLSMKNMIIDQLDAHPLVLEVDEINYRKNRDFFANKGWIFGGHQI